VSDDIARYFEVCGYQPDDLINIGTQQSNGPPRFSFVKVSDAPRQITARPKTANVWIGACPTVRPEQGRGTASDIVRVDSLWADLDVKKTGLESMGLARRVIGEVSMLIGATPVAVVMSGHGLQPRWRLEEPMINDHPETARIVKDFGRLVQHVADRLGGKVDSVHDLARILRAPGSVNNKDEPVDVTVEFPESATWVAEWKLQDAFDDYLPVEQPPLLLPKSSSVNLGRGNAWLQGALRGIQTELSDAQDWPIGHLDSRDRGWDKLTADAARRLAEIAKAEWNSLTEPEAHDFLMLHAPRGEGWGPEQIEKKWHREFMKADPAESPVERKVQSDDPLEENYVAPPMGANAGADGRDGGSDRVNGGAPASVVGPAWRRYSWDDFGNAERVTALYGDVLRWSSELDVWLRYTDGVWVEDKVGGAYLTACMLRRLDRLESDFYDDTEEPGPRGEVTSERIRFRKWLKTQRYSARCKSASDTIKAEHMLDVKLSEFDVHPLMICVLNGIVDLTTGELLPHDPAMMFRAQAPLHYDPDAAAPEWGRFLGRVQPEMALAEYLHRIVGYSITGSTGEQAVFIHQGPPASGKSVFLRVMEATLGPQLSRVVPSDLLLSKKMETHPTGLMGLEGRRMLQVSETPEGARLDEALVKRLSGEETITARGMRQDFRDFRIVGKVHMATNHRPHISDDRAVHRRLHLVEWNVEIPEWERDPGLADRIISTELPGVFAWAVRGALAWRQDRLAKPVQAEMALAGYFEEEDEFGQWMDERLIITGKDGARTPSDQLYRGYRQWAESRGSQPMAMPAWARRLSTRGVERWRTSTARGFCAVLTTPSIDPLER
jgi:putative DNA primase/helicase